MEFTEEEIEKILGNALGCYGSGKTLRDRVVFLYGHVSAIYAILIKFEELKKEKNKGEKNGA